MSVSQADENAKPPTSERSGQKMSEEVVSQLDKERIPASQSLARDDVKVEALSLAPRANTFENLPIVKEPPPLEIPAEELEADRTLFRIRAENRGERSNRYRAWDAAGSDEDVNGFRDTSEGKRAKKKRRKGGAPGHRGGLAASLNMEADYDVRVPNDFLAFKQLLAERGRMKERWNWSRMHDDEWEEEEGTDLHRHSERFAPPASYQFHADGARGQAEEEEDKPYLSPPPPGPPPVKPDAGPKAAHTHAMTGEEAYLRRVALSQQAQTKEDAAFSQPKDDFSSRAAAAAAIAARLASSASPSQKEIATNDSTSGHHESASFAERLMARQGWRKGEALGVEGNKGLLKPILAERSKDVDRTHTAVGPSNNRGTIRNVQEEERRREERIRYGEPSEVLLLTNMLSNDEQIDEDLPEEIASECGKHGFVDRVFILPSFSSSDVDVRQSGRPQIFVRFTGMAGAWRCLKELDGRFFAGNTVRARYYPLRSFEAGLYDEKA